MDRCDSTFEINRLKCYYDWQLQALDIATDPILVSSNSPAPHLGFLSMDYRGSFVPALQDIKGIWVQSGLRTAGSLRNIDSRINFCKLDRPIGDPI